MKKEITRYKNEVNTIPMRDWTREEMNFFFAILTKLRDEGNRRIFFDKYGLAELANYSIEHNQRYEKTMENLANKIAKLTYKESSSNSFKIMPLFTYFEATWADDLSDLTLQVSVNEDFEYILNQWHIGQWTSFELKEFTAINSTYSKTLFRLLKQWRMQGMVQYSVDDFRQLLSIPNSYKNSHINERIIKNALDDLKPYFKNLKVKIVKSNKRGNPVLGYEFTFEPEKTGVWIEDKYEQVENEEPNLPFKNWLKENDI